MLPGLNSLQSELVEKGFAEMPKQHKPKYKQFKCNKCKHIMTKVPDSNIMYCSQCGNYFLFDKVM